jgi:hypothetical protein
MKGAEMSGVRLDGAFMRGAKLVGANLRTALLDRETSIAGVQLVDERGVSPRFADVRWGDADIDRTNWTIVKVLGDNVIDHQFFAGTAGNERERRLRLLTDAVRANRQIATLLRGRGLTDEADRFAYQAQVLQRRLNFKVRRYGRWLFSELLSVLSGYGYRLGNIFRAYVVVVAFFALAYVFSPFLSTGHVPSGQDVLNAVQISLNAIHGRVFFAQFSLDTLQSWLATAESICGIVIEGVFVAMLIQRLFR